MKYHIIKYLRLTTIVLVVLLSMALFSESANAGPRTKYYADTDGDSYGDPNNWVRQETQPPGYVLDNTDCDDTDPNVNPGVSEVCGDGIDNNCDSQIDEGCGGGCDDNDGDGYNDAACGGTDCDDTDPSINPGAEDICGDAIDQNCDGEDPACDASKGRKFYYRDDDGDSYGTPLSYVEAKNPPEGYVNNNVDCDDTDPNINPFVEEICDGIDNNCDGQIDEGCVTYYEDADSDTYGNPAVSVEDTTQPAGYVTDNTDCDDTDPNINPSVAEIADDGIDQNCNGYDLATYYADTDGDSYGDPNVSQQVDAAQPAGYVTDNTDCDDTDPNVNPGAAEVPDDGIDNNCDGFQDNTYYADSDSDTYGDPNVSQVASSQPAGYVLDNTDCDDTDPNINPGVAEIADDGIDQNCNGYDLATYYADTDGDSYGDPNVSQQLDDAQPAGYVSDNTDCDDTDPNVNPNTPEIEGDGIDNNCDGQIDENCVILVPADKATIQDAIDFAADGCEIRVAEGFYFESINFIGKDIIVRAEVPGPLNTVIGGGVPDSVVIMISGEPPTAVLDGFSILNGMGSDLVSPGIYKGGGILISGVGTDPTITNCFVSSNSADFGSGIYCGNGASPTIQTTTVESNFGGGIYLESADTPVIRDCNIDFNMGGSGIWIQGPSSPVIDHCAITRNDSPEGGGVLITGGASPVIDRCTISENWADLGGGIACLDLLVGPMNPAFSNCNIFGNRANFSGGGIYIQNVAPMGPLPTIVNCTIAHNEAFMSGGGISIAPFALPVIKNSIIWMNYAPENLDIDDGGSPQDITYCDVTGGYNGTGNIDADPLFVAPLPSYPIGDYHLQPGSPCIDKGNLMDAPFWDIDMEPRPMGLEVDIGSDEAQ